MAETITAVATKEHKELKENFPVIYVLFCGETGFGFIPMQMEARRPRRVTPEIPASAGS